MTGYVVAGHGAAAEPAGRVGTRDSHGVARVERFVSDRGAGTVLVVALVAVAVLLLGAVVLVGQAVAANASAATGADLAALAAADAARGLTWGDPCRVAERVAVANEVRLAECSISEERGGIATVTVESPMPQPWPSAKQTARAGAPP